jgi:ABC-2 type transport system ATP-binding protein
MAQAEDMCEHIVMIHRGRKVLDDPIASIRSRYDPRTILFDPLDPGMDVSAARSLDGVEQLRSTEKGYELQLAEGSDVSLAMQRLTAAVPVARVQLARPRLEDIFIDLVSRDGAEGNTLRTELTAREEATA